MKSQNIILLLCLFMIIGCTNTESIADQRSIQDEFEPQNEIIESAKQQDEIRIPEPSSNDNNVQSVEELLPPVVGQLYNKAIFTPELISVSLEGNEILKTYLQSPADFPVSYDLDQLYRKGICTMDISEEEFIKFDDRYDGEILPGLRIGDPVTAVKDLLGEPQFADMDLGYIGYRTKECYFAIEGNEKVISVVFVKNYHLPAGYEKILDSVKVDNNFHNSFDIAGLIDRYPEYSFSGQLDRGGISLIYPFGIEFHAYSGKEILVYTNFTGEIVNSAEITYTMRDSHESRLRAYFYNHYKYHLIQSESEDRDIVSPDGKKRASQGSWNAYTHKIHIYPSDDSFAPRQFRYGGRADKVEWINNDILFYCDTYFGSLGFYSCDADENYYSDWIEGDGFWAYNLSSIEIDRENQIITGECELNDEDPQTEDQAALLHIRYNISDNFAYEIEILPNHTQCCRISG